MRTSVWSRAALGLAMVCICSKAAFPRAAGSISTTDLRVPGRDNATPSIAADGKTAAVVWGASLPDGATDIFIATSRDGGRTFGAPTRVNDVHGDARVNGEQPPRVAFDRRGLVVVWTAKGQRGTVLLQARSSDGGHTFTTAALVPGTDAAGNRGGKRRLAGGRVDVVWLDHRELAQRTAKSPLRITITPRMRSDRPDGVAMAQKSKLYVAALDGAGGQSRVTGGVCYCCKTAIAAAADGSIYAAWRHVYPGNIRDIAFTVSRDGGRTFATPLRVSEDKWVLEGCPDDGPAMAIDSGGRIHIVWPTLVTEGGTETIALFYAVSIDGEAFTPRARIAAQGIPHHPQIAIGGDGTPVIAWDESGNGSRRGAMARVVPGGHGAARFMRVVLDDMAVYPVVAASDGASVFAWTSGKSPDSVIRVEVGGHEAAHRRTYRGGRARDLPRARRLGSAHRKPSTRRASAAA